MEQLKSKHNASALNLVDVYAKNEILFFLMIISVFGRASLSQSVCVRMLFLGQHLLNWINWVYQHWQRCSIRSSEPNKVGYAEAELKSKTKLAQPQNRSCCHMNTLWILDA